MITVQAVLEADGCFEQLFGLNDVAVDFYGMNRPAAEREAHAYVVLEGWEDKTRMFDGPTAWEDAVKWVNGLLIQKVN